MKANKIVQKAPRYTLMLSILPVIMMYKVPFVGMGVSTILIMVSMIYALYVALANINNVKVNMLLPIYLYFLYVMTKSSLQNVELSIAILLHLSAISTGIVNVPYLRKTIETVAIMATIGVIAQQIFHLFIGKHIPLVAPLYLLDSLSSYTTALLTGITKEGLYRPCSFFLEPSHFSAYCIIALGSSLYHEIPMYKKAIFITIGMLLTTSGIGLVLSAVVWGWWYMTEYKTFSLHKIVIRVSLLLSICFILYMILDNISYFHVVFSRIIGNSGTDYNAIDGRLFWWDTYFGDKAFTDFLWGYGEENLPDEYFTGFMKQIYAYGITGFVLFVLYVLVFILKSKKFPNLSMCIYFGLLFVSNHTGFISMIFYLGVLLALYLEQLNNKYLLLSNENK